MVKILCKIYVKLTRNFQINECTENGQPPPNWLVEISNRDSNAVTSYTRFCTRGYAFKIHEDGKKTETSDYGVSATGGDVIYYRILNEILEIRYPGILDLRCIVFFV